jgi:cysteine desulfurase/selenocysteine lyase
MSEAATSSPLPLAGGVGGPEAVDTPTPNPSRKREGDRKRDFPGLVTAGGKPWHYLDSAATAQKPRAVIDAVTKAIGADYATVHRGVYTRSAEMTLGYEAARRRVAAFIGGREDEVVFTRGATEAINLVAYSYPQKGRVLLSQLDHHSNIVPWQLAGWQIDVCPLTDDGKIDLDAAERMLTPDHQMVAFAHVSNVLGSVLDARRAAELAHSVGAKLLLDGCQAVPRMAVDVAALGCDFYAFSGHKLYGPTGIGALWARHDLLAAMPPWQGGGSMIDRVTFEKTTYAPPPQRFEAGTPAIVEAIGLGAACDYVAAIGLDAMPPYQGGGAMIDKVTFEQTTFARPPQRFEAGTPAIVEAIGFGAACDYVSAIGLDAIHVHEARLVAATREALRGMNDVTVFGPDGAAGIVSFAIRGVHPHDLGTILDEEDVAIRAGHHCAQPLMDRLGVDATARASFGLYSDEDDIAALLRGIERTKRLFG